MTARIHLLIGGHLSTAPRAQKEACALTEAGYDVRVSGIWHDEKAAEQDRLLMGRHAICFAPALDFRPGSRFRAGVRARRRLALEAYRWSGYFSPELLGYGARELLAVAEKEKADLTIVHSEAGLWVAAQLLRQGRVTGVDFEDWFSRDLSPAAQRLRPVQELARLEENLLRQARYRLAPSRVLACALGNVYKIRPPMVVRNVLPAHPQRDDLRQDRRDDSVLSIHWFSQTIGPGRGLELLFQSLPLLKSWVQIYLRGACPTSARAWLDRLIPPGWNHRVVILGPVPGDELPSRIAEHDIGLALETPRIPSRDLTITNKIFHYFQAGLAIIATPTQGQREVFATCAGAGTLLPESTPQALAEAIDRYASHPEWLAETKRKSRHLAETKLCWESEKHQLLAEAEEALAPRMKTCRLPGLIHLRR